MYSPLYSFLNDTDNEIGGTRTTILPKKWKLPPKKTIKPIQPGIPGSFGRRISIPKPSKEPRQVGQSIFRPGETGQIISRVGQTTPTTVTPLVPMSDEEVLQSAGAVFNTSKILFVTGVFILSFIFGAAIGRGTGNE